MYRTRRAGGGLVRRGAVLNWPISRIGSQRLAVRRRSRSCSRTRKRGREARRAARAPGGPAPPALGRRTAVGRAQEAPLRRASHPDEVRAARLGGRAGVGPVRGAGAHVRGLIARARPSARYRYRTAYGQKDKELRGEASGFRGPPQLLGRLNNVTTAS
ncbi:hypothetical protein KGM_200822 [Danaus plexippus plexippus]|uniref:Uncharacterized protein n=1 Tax=Danaus plexippus plexippus TaxID=278856 RepID=A0A212EZ44_DANPL|nr:hypothetical protein KGM_200822 [Danaus plexippus plexippus]